MSEDLTLKAAELARRLPEEWIAFVSAFADYAHGAKTDMVMYSGAELQVMQGRAQQCVKLEDLFRNAVKNARIVEEKRSKARRP